MLHAELVVQTPDGNENTFQLAESTIVIGRTAPAHTPDLDLGRPGSVVSRVHCVLEAEFGSWWLTDNASRNGTFVRDARGRTEKIEGRRRLDHGEVIVILSHLEGIEQHFWELRLVDPNATTQVGAVVADRTDEEELGPYLRWIPAEMRLERVVEGSATEVQLRKQGFSLIDHMISRNQENAGVPVVCGPDELLEAVWGPPESWDPYHPPTVENLRDLVSDVRKAVEPDIKRPQLLQNLRGVGYRLHGFPSARG